MLNYIKRLFKAKKKPTWEKVGNDWICRKHNMIIQIDNQALEVPYGGSYKAYVNQLKKVIEASNS